MPLNNILVASLRLVPYAEDALCRPDIILYASPFRRVRGTGLVATQSHGASTSIASIVALIWQPGMSSRGWSRTTTARILLTGRCALRMAVRAPRASHSSRIASRARRISDFIPSQKWNDLGFLGVKLPSHTAVAVAAGTIEHTLHTVMFLYHIEIGRLRLRSHYERVGGADERLAKFWNVGVAQNEIVRRSAFQSIEQDNLVRSFCFCG